MATRSKEELIGFANPIITPCAEPSNLGGVIEELVLIAVRSNSPNQAKKSAKEFCLRQGFYWETAEQFAKSCRHLAILHRDYPLPIFLELFNSNITLMQKISAHEHERRES